MKTYYANFNANNGTRLSSDLEDTNLARIIKTIRDIAEGNRFADGNCSWAVYEQDDDCMRCVAAGGYNACGGRYRVKDAELKWMTY